MRFALVGCGRIAKRHADILSSGAVAGTELAAVCDVKRERAEDFSQTYGVPSFLDMCEMMTDIKPDAVSVLTESGLHAQHVVELARFGKPIIVEKPMALMLDDADRMIAACAETGARLFVVKQNRFNVPIQATRRALEAGRLGKMVMGTVRVRWCRRQDYYDQDPWRGTWAFDGGVLANQASHHVDVLNWMLGEPTSVFGVSRTALVDIEAEDTAAVVIRYRSGAIGIVEATTATRPADLEGSLSLLGERGTIEVGGFALNQLKTWRFDDEEQLNETALSEFSENPPDVYGFGHRAYYEHVLNAIMAGTPGLVDGLEGRRSLELLSAIYESIETRREVSLRFEPRECRLGLAP